MRIYPDETIQKSMTESITTVSNVSGYSPLYVAFMYITLWRFIRTLRPVFHCIPPVSYTHLTLPTNREV